MIDTNVRVRAPPLRALSVNFGEVDEASCLPISAPACKARLQSQLARFPKKIQNLPSSDYPALQGPGPLLFPLSFDGLLRTSANAQVPARKITPRELRATISDRNLRSDL